MFHIVRPRCFAGVSRVSRMGVRVYSRMFRDVSRVGCTIVVHMTSEVACGSRQRHWWPSLHFQGLKFAENKIKWVLIIL